MPITCCINGCKNSSWKIKGNNNEVTIRKFPEDKQIGFHSFPKKKELCQQWEYCIQVCNNQISFGRNPRVCSDHFKESDIKRKRNVVLSAAAVPCIFPNSKYSDYDVLLLENKENAEPEQLRSKKLKLDVEHLKSKASSSAFFPPLLLTDDFMMTGDTPMKEANENYIDSVEDLTAYDDTAMSSTLNKAKACIDFVEGSTTYIDTVMTSSVNSNNATICR